MIQDIIEQGYKNIDTITQADSELYHTVERIINQLNNGSLKVAEKIEGQWITHSWIKQAILLYFKLSRSKVNESMAYRFFDKIPLKFLNHSYEDFERLGVRVVPGALARYGCFVAKNSILMPSFINIGANIGAGTMIDTWATVGSCAQIGAKVHISGGVGIGGVLEPLQNNPTIIEDGCFIGARSEIVEGVIVGEGSVISMGVYIGQSTKIYDRNSDKIIMGQIPPYSVVVSGTLPSGNGKYSTYAAIIMKQVDQATRAKVSINELLRV